MTHLIHTYGYLAVFVVLSLEAFGIPIPGEPVLIAAGTYAGTSHHLSVWVIWLVAFAGVELGASVGFWVGVKGGYRLLLRYGRYIRMREPQMKAGRYLFDRYGGVVVSGGRFVAGLRTYAAFLAGTNRMNAGKFQVFNIAGAVAWTGMWSLLSYYVGDAPKSVKYVIVAVAAVLAVVAVLVIRKQAKRLEELAEKAYPGPLPD